MIRLYSGKSSLDPSSSTVLDDPIIGTSYPISAQIPRIPMLTDELGGEKLTYPRSC